MSPIILLSNAEHYCASFVTGFYWEQAAAISNRHPADCLHAYVDFSPLKADESRTVMGKFYWIEGTKEDLFAAWRREFEDRV